MIEDEIERQCNEDLFVVGACKWCDDEGRVYRDTGLCENCDDQVFHCAICDEDQHEDDTCRHLFRDEEWEWCGSGAGAPNDGRIEASFHRLLSAMPGGFARDLKAAIISGRFHTWLVAPMIGGGGILTLYGMPRSVGQSYGDTILALGESDEAEDFECGYHWLVSLFDDKTPDANALTVEWIDRWQSSQPASRNEAAPALDATQEDKDDG